MRAVIMAGGEGKRLRPFTHSIPKPLLPIGKKPIAQIIIERLRQFGIVDIIMSLEYSGDLIRAFFQDGRQFGVNIDYYKEPHKMGTAGCLAHIPVLREEPFIVTNGDILSHIQYTELMQKHTESGTALTVATRMEEVLIAYGVLHTEGNEILRVEEKPKYRYCFNAGIYALSPLSLEYVPKEGVFDMTDLINAVLANGHRVGAYPLEGLWFDLAKVGDFEKAVAELERSYPEYLQG